MNGMTKTVEMGTMEQAGKVVREGLDKAGRAGRWMAALWWIDGDGKIRLNKTSWQFPDGDVEEAQRLLKEVLTDERMQRQGLDTSPLPDPVPGLLRSGPEKNTPKPSEYLRNLSAGKDEPGDVPADEGPDGSP